MRVHRTTVYNKTDKWTYISYNMYKNTRLSRWTGRIDVVSSGCRSFGSTVGGEESTPSGGQSRATRRAVGRRSAKAIQWPWPTSQTGPSCAGAASTALYTMREAAAADVQLGRYSAIYAHARRHRFLHTVRVRLLWNIPITIIIIIICRCTGCYYPLPAFPLCHTNIYSIIYYVVLPILSPLNYQNLFPH